MKRTTFTILPFIFVLLHLPLGAQEPQPAYKNPALPLEQRVDDLISRMTLHEKVSQLGHTADAIPRLGVPQYDWWNEGLHGLAHRVAENFWRYNPVHHNRPVDAYAVVSTSWSCAKRR